MTNNDILRRLRYAFDLSDRAATALFSANPGAFVEMSIKGYLARLAKEDDSQFAVCSDAELAAFLDGLIVAKRGLRGTGPGSEKDSRRVSPEQKRHSQETTYCHELPATTRCWRLWRKAEPGCPKVSSEAFFRTPGHKHFRTCGNQVLRNFIKGLTIELRGSAPK